MDLRPLPPSLQGRAFTILGGTNEGVSKSRMLRGDLSRPTHGVRSHGEPSTLLELAAATALALPPDVAFSHATSAGLRHLPLPQEAWKPLHVIRTSDHQRIRRKGCRGHLGLERRQLSLVEGLRAVSVHDTWVDLADLDLDDLVVLGDAIAARDGSVEGLTAALDRLERVPHRLRSAAGLVRVGSESPMETRSRLVFVRGGLPEPELNASIFDLDGEWIARADFLWRQARVIGEYQGAFHFGDFERGDADIGRRLLLQDQGYRFVEITKRDVFEAARRHTLVRRLARMLAE